ncbi:MAG: restriction endonuclease subunit S [Actinobacteria bacterium]|nr:restriction endonuclease subunit S [Actinomycetota bacterium]
MFGSAGRVGSHDTPNTHGPVIIVGRKGSFGKVAYSTDPVFVIDTAYFIDQACTDADLRWLWYSLRAARLDDLSQDVGVPGLSREAAYQARIPFPPLDRQRPIARFLDFETDRIEQVMQAKRRLLALLTEKRRSLYVAAVAGQLTGDSDRGSRAHIPWLPLIPDRWSVAKLTLVARLGTGHTPSRSKSAYWDSYRDIPWITTSDIERFRNDRVNVLTETKERISRIGLENSAAVLHPRGTVALSRTASVGFSVVMGTDMATSQDFVTWTCSPLLEPQFLLICLRAMRPDLVGRLAIGSTHKTIYMPDIESLRIPLPPIREQRAIIEFVGRETCQLDQIAARVHRQLRLFAERRDALINAAITGQLDPSSYRESSVAA